MGPAFEDTTRQKQAGNADFAFLFGGPGSEYYQWHLHCLKTTMSDADIEKAVIAAEIKANVSLRGACDLIPVSVAAVAGVVTCW